MAKGRDRPRHQQKRKPKEKAAKLPAAHRPMSPPMSVEVVKTKAQAAQRTRATRSDLRRRAGSDERKEPADDDGSPGGPARTESPSERRARPRGRRRHPADREAVRPRRDHASRRQGRAPTSTSSRPARSPWTSPWEWAACRAAGSPRSSARSRAARRRSATTSLRNAQRDGGIVAFIDAEHALDPVRGERRRQRRRAPRQPAGHRRAGPRDRGDADPQQRRRRRDRGLGRRPGAARRDRGRDGGQLRRPPGAPHEPGAAQADRRDQPLEHGARLHQPAAREDRRHVRKPRDDPRRPRAEVLLLGAAGHPPHRDAQDRHRRDRLADPGQGGEEQGRLAVPASRSSTSCTTRASAARAGCSTWASPPGILSKTGAWFNYGETRLGQGRENARDFLKSNPEIATKIDDEIRGKVASIEVGVEGISEAK